MIDAISIAILFGPLLGSVIFIVFLQKDRIAQHRLFILFISLLLLDQVFMLFLRFGWLPYDLMNINLPNILLFGPLLYLYGQEVLIERKISINRVWWHFIPFLTVATYTLGLNFISFRPDIIIIDGRSMVGFLVIHLSIYAVFGIFGAIRFRTSNPHNILNASRIRWILFLNSALFIAAVLWVVSSRIVINNQLIINEIIPPYSIDLFSVLVTYGIVIYLVRTPAFLQTRNGKAKYKKSTLSSDLQKQKLDQVLQAIESNKLYLHPDFSLSFLSDRTGLSRHHISQIINNQLNCSFVELTHRYRIPEAQRRLIENGEGFLKIEQLAYELGYKSKSAFFSAFKKATGLTPQNFVASIQSKV